MTSLAKLYNNALRQIDKKNIYLISTYISGHNSDTVVLSIKTILRILQKYTNLELIKRVKNLGEAQLQDRLKSKFLK